jgi:hypothetical protein
MSSLWSGIGHIEIMKGNILDDFLFLVHVTFGNGYILLGFKIILSGAVKRVGRSDSYATEYDLEAEEYVPIPKGDVHKKKEIVQDVTLHDLDMANARPQGGHDFLSLMS